MYNSKEHYYKYSIDEHLLVLDIIKKNPDKKEFYIMDIGAGNFQFGKNLANFINDEVKNGNISSDIIINILGVRSEKYTGAEIINEGNCKLYNFVSFFVENMLEAFAQIGIVNIHFDFVVSS